MPQKSSPQTTKGSGGVDFASINAAGADASGEFIRDARKSRGRATEQKTIAEKPAIKNPQPTKEGGKEEKKEYVIPVLRTYHQDTKHIAQTKGGAELRTIISKRSGRETRRTKRIPEKYQGYYEGVNGVAGQVY